jgi:hypothetical protein
MLTCRRIPLKPPELHLSLRLQSYNFCRQSADSRLLPPADLISEIEHLHYANGSHIVINPVARGQTIAALHIDSPHALSAAQLIENGMSIVGRSVRQEKPLAKMIATIDRI